MNIVLWILQVLLAAEFAWHGSILLFPPAELVDIMNAEFSLWFRMLLGSAEVLAAVGLILPGVLKVAPWMIPVTAVCLMFVMVSATIHHLNRGENTSAIITIGIFLILTFVAYMRWKVKPLPRKHRIESATQ